MKKLTALLLALTMIFCLAACSGGDKENTGDPTPEVSEEPSAEPTAEPTPDPAEAVEATASSNLADITMTRIDKYFTAYGDATYTVKAEDDTVYAKIFRENSDYTELDISLYAKPIDASGKTPADASGLAAYYNEHKCEFVPATIGNYSGYVEHKEFSNNFSVQDTYLLDYPTENGNVVLMFFCKHSYQKDSSQMQALEAAVLDNLKVVAKTAG